jgi:hypothetical protein
MRQNGGSTQHPINYNHITFDFRISFNVQVHLATALCSSWRTRLSGVVTRNKRFLWRPGYPYLPIADYYQAVSVGSTLVRRSIVYAIKHAPPF